MKKKYILLIINILLTLSVFLPLKVKTVNPEIGVVTSYYSCFDLLIDGHYVFTLPYIFLLLIFVVTSICFNKNKIIKVINLISILMMTLIGMIAFINFFSIAAIYAFVYLFSIIAILKIWKEENIKGI